MAQLSTITASDALGRARGRVRRILSLAREANADLAQAEDALVEHEADLDAHKARLTDLGIQVKESDGV